MPKNKKEKTKRSLGTFEGVFTPSILTIFGVIMYLRLGWVVGTAGLVNALTIIIVAGIITFITGLSISSIATNMEVKTGGAYYMISRSLGFSMGGSIGLPLFLSQALSVPLYVVGFVESLRLVFPDVHMQFYSIVTVIIITILSFIGAKFIIRVQFLILGAIILSFFSYFSGSIHISTSTITPVLWETFSENMNYWKVFAIYFPAVTGILAGISMSGDLKTPQRSLPAGTIAAIICGFIVYFFIAFTLAFSATSAELTSNYLIMPKLAKWPYLVIAGIWGATISSAFGSILSAPRTLQALARDKILPPILGNGYGKQDEPLIGIAITFLISLIAVTYGSLNSIAPILTMFFLTTYGTLNLEAGLETLIQNPQYRPQFKTPWYISILGAFACFATMFLINAVMSIIAITTITLIFYMLKKQSLQQTWGDISKGFWISIVNFCLSKLKKIKDDPKNWRPNILVFSQDPSKQKDLVKVAHWFGQHTGIVMVCNLIMGKLEQNVRELIRSDRKTEAFIKEQELDAFTSTSVIEHLEKDTAIISQSAGVGDIKPNTILFPWKNLKKSEQKSFIAMIRNQFYIGKNTLIMATNPRDVFSDNKNIDIWWGGEDRNIELILLLAYLLKLNEEWKDANITIKTIIENEKERKKKEALYHEFLFSARINANIEMLKHDKKKTITETIIENSIHTEIVFLGLAYPDKGLEKEYYQNMEPLANAFPVTLFVRNSKRGGGEIV